MMAGEKIQRPKFERKPTKKQPTPGGSNESPPSPPPISEDGAPSEAAYKAIPDLRTARPKDFFDLQLTLEFVSKVMVNCTNACAALEGAGVGGTTFTDFVPFDLKEVYNMIGVLCANGLSPKPPFELWFVMTEVNRLFGNNYVAAAIDKQLPRGERVRGKRR